MLPPPTSLPPSVISFLNAKLSTREDLEQVPDLVSELRNQCNALDQCLFDLNKQLENYLIDYASDSERINGLLGDINAKVKDLQSSSHTATSSSGKMDANYASRKKYLFFLQLLSEFIAIRIMCCFEMLCRWRSGQDFGGGVTGTGKGGGES